MNLTVSPETATVAPATTLNGDAALARYRSEYVGEPDGTTRPASVKSNESCVVVVMPVFCTYHDRLQRVVTPPGTSLPVSELNGELWPAIRNAPSFRASVPMPKPDCPAVSDSLPAAVRPMPKTSRSYSPIAAGVAGVEVVRGQGDVPARAERVLDEDALGVVEHAVVDDGLAEVAVEEAVDAGELSPSFWRAPSR